MRHLSRRLASGLALLMAGLLAVTTSAQPATPGSPGQAPVGVLADVQVAQLPSPDAEIWFLRYTLEPGGFLPSQLQMGPTVIVIEQGVVTLESDQPVAVTGSGAEPTISGDPPTYRTTVEASQTANVPANCRLAIRNETDTPAMMLVLIVYAPEMETAGMSNGEDSGEPSGLTVQPLAVTRAAFPASAGAIRIERIAVEAGGTLPADTPDGAVAGVVEQGNATLTAVSGACIAWPGITTAAQDAEPVQTEIGPGQSVEQVAGDGFGCANGAVSWQAGDAGVTILRATITPLVVATPPPAAPT